MVLPQEFVWRVSTMSRGGLVILPRLQMTNGPLRSKSKKKINSKRLYYSIALGLVQLSENLEVPIVIQIGQPRIISVRESFKDHWSQIWPNFYLRFPLVCLHLAPGLGPILINGRTQPPRPPLTMHAFTEVFIRMLSYYRQSSLTS